MIILDLVRNAASSQPSTSVASRGFFIEKFSLAFRIASIERSFILALEHTSALQSSLLNNGSLNIASFLDEVSSINESPLRCQAFLCAITG
jgi:hypothetical protein